MPATSEPPPGSVTASEPIISPASVGRTNRSTRSACPCAAMCGSAMPPVNSAAISPLDAPASNIASCSATESSRSPPSPPTSSGNATPSSPCLRGGQVQLARHLAGVLPLLEVRHDLAAHELRGGVLQRGALVGSFTAAPPGCATMPRAHPLAEPLGLRVEPGRRGDALAEQPVDHDVDARRGWAARRPRRRGPRPPGSSSRTLLRVDQLGQPGDPGVVRLASRRGRPTARGWRRRPCRRSGRARTCRAASGG